MGRLPHGSVVQGLLDELPATTLDGGSAGMLPRGCYTSPEFFEFERGRLRAVLDLRSSTPG